MRPEVFPQKLISARKLLQALSAITAIMMAAGLKDALDVATLLNVSLRSVSWVVLFSTLTLSLMVSLGSFIFAFFPGITRFLVSIRGFKGQFQAFEFVSKLFFAVLSLVLPALVFLQLGEPFDELGKKFYWRVMVFWLTGLLSASLVYLAAPQISFRRQLVKTFVLYGGIYRLALFLPGLSTSPFSLTWSEASRYYYASTFFAEKIYDIAVRPTVLHPTRYMLQSLPFLVDGLSIFFHRAWQVFLWLTTNLLAAWLLTRRLKPRGDASNNWFVVYIWAFLFLFQGPIWYHLVVMIVIVLWGAEPARFRRTLIVVMAASAWAGISRINWIPFPATLAGILYLLEIPRKERSLPAYFAWPVGWGLAGILVGFLSQWLYAVSSGNNLSQFSSSLTSDLLWYRLFPNSTFPLGVLPGIFLATAPLFISIWYLWRGRFAELGHIRLLTITGLLLVFLIGGLVVSTKIGGGSNLHNLDAYIALLLVAGSYLVVDGMTRRRQIPMSIVGFLIAVPIGMTLSLSGKIGNPRSQDIAHEYELFSNFVEIEAKRGASFLFINARHLLALEMLQDVSLIEDYEKVFLMEMAMSRNQDYLERFESDLATREIDYIIVEPLRIDYQSRSEEFSEENNIWDAEVSYRLLCYYQVHSLYKSSKVQVLEPQKGAPECP